MQLPNRHTECHIMVDLETLDLAPTARITEIGAINVFDDFNDPAYLNGFHLDVHDPDGTMSMDTCTWRLDRNLSWKNEEEAYALHRALSLFGLWINEHRGRKELFVWCKGTDFDIPILRFAYARAYMITPWKYNNVRDVRTLLSLFPEYKIPEEMKPHKALGDAKNQANQLLQCIGALGAVNGMATSNAS